MKEGSKIERIVKIGPFELYGRRRGKPPEETENLKRAMTELRDVVLHETPVGRFAKRTVEWLSRLLSHKNRGGA